MITYLKKIEGQDFEFLDKHDYDNTDGMTPIRLLNGPYEGLEYIYGRTNISLVDDIGENGTLKFQFRVLNRDKEEYDKLRQDKDFIQYLGEVLNSIIIDNMEYE